VTDLGIGHGLGRAPRIWVPLFWAPRSSFLWRLT